MQCWISWIRTGEGGEEEGVEGEGPSREKNFFSVPLETFSREKKKNWDEEWRVFSFFLFHLDRGL